MAFVLEDGTGLSNSNSYASVAEFKAYHGDRGTDISSLSGSDIEQNLIVATDFIERRWGNLFLDEPLLSTQALSFPRKDLEDKFGNDIDGIPTKLKWACIEYAYQNTLSSLFNQPTVDATGVRVLKTRSKVGPIEDEVQYSDTGRVETTKSFPNIDPLMFGFISSAGSVIRG